jgi:hypothetical protein
MQIARGIASRPIAFALLGLLTGAAAAGCTFMRLGDVAPFEIGGYCLGVLPITGAHCGGIDAAVYVFPGLVFGVVFGPLLRLRRQLSLGGVAAYAAGSCLGNAVAVAVCISALHPIDDILPFDILELDIAIAGIIAGAVGAGLLGTFFALLDRAAGRLLPIAVGAGLGALTPLVIMIDDFGVFAFYMIWQGGYAAAVAISSPERLRQQ